MRHTLLVLASALVVGAAVTTASAAVKPKPWQWTTAQALAAMEPRQEEIVYVRGGPLDVTSCRGLGRRYVGRRYVAFRCSGAYTEVGLDENRGTISAWARTRRSGGLCWSTEGLAHIPKSCLANGRRVEGTARDAETAMKRVVGTINHDFRCLAHGSGFYSCSWMKAETTFRGTVVFTPSGTIVRELP